MCKLIFCCHNFQLHYHDNFPLSQNSHFNRLKCRWYTQIKWKFWGTNELPLEVLYFYCHICTNFYFHFTVILHHYKTFLMYQRDCKFALNLKKPFHLTQKVARISNQKFWLNIKNFEKGFRAAIKGHINL